MSDFRQLSATVFASPQIAVEDIAEAARLGVTLVINNRPEGESPDQTPGDAIATAAHGAGMEYLAIPITMDTLSEGDVTAMAEAMAQAEGPVLAYCRSGTRSTLVWALAQAMAGADLEETAAAAAAAGYDIAPVRGAMETLAARNR